MTAQQKQLLRFLKEQSELGECPTYAEIAAALKLRSKGHVAKLIYALEERGYIVHQRRRARSIQVVQHFCPNCGHSLQDYVHAAAVNLRTGART